MAKLKWSDIRDALRAADPAPVGLSRELFWEKFRARAGAIPPPGVRRRPTVKGMWPKLAVAAASVAVLTSFLILPLVRDSGRPEVPGSRTRSSDVEEIQVYAPYSSLMIMKDSITGGTIVWVTDLKLKAGT